MEDPQDRTGPPSVRWRNLRWLKMMLRSDSDAATNYDLWGAPEHMRTDSGQPAFNMGYWKDVAWDQPDAIRMATEALFQLVGEAAELGAGDQVVLDAGCGFGTNALYMLRTFGPRKVIGLNVSSFQLRWCRRLLQAEELLDRAEFFLGSATDMPFAEASCDKVVSIEAAFHFHTRADFFREAFRVLRPGGTLAIADLLAVPPRSVAQQANLSLLRRSLQIPAANVYGADRYVEELRAAGFAIERTTSLRDHVLPTYTKWAGRDPLRDLRKVSLAQLLSTITCHLYPWDYALFKARKPLLPPHS